MLIAIGLPSLGGSLTGRLLLPSLPCPSIAAGLIVGGSLNGVESVGTLFPLLALALSSPLAPASRLSSFARFLTIRRLPLRILGIVRFVSFPSFVLSHLWPGIVNRLLKKSILVIGRVLGTFLFSAALHAPESAGIDTSGLYPTAVLRVPLFCGPISHLSLTTSHPTTGHVTLPSHPPPDASPPLPAPPLLTSSPGTRVHDLTCLYLSTALLLNPQFVRDTSESRSSLYLFLLPPSSPPLLSPLQ